MGNIVAKKFMLKRSTVHNTPSNVMYKIEPSHLNRNGRLLLFPPKTSRYVITDKISIGSFYLLGVLNLNVRA